MDPRRNIVIVKMLRSLMPYLEGQTVGLPSEKAEKLIEKGQAAKVGDGKPLTRADKRLKQQATQNEAFKK